MQTPITPHRTTRIMILRPLSFRLINPMKRTITLLTALLLSPLALLSAAEKSKPNIVFIFADDWGWGISRVTAIRG